MRNLIFLFFVAGIFLLSGCGSKIELNSADFHVEYGYRIRYNNLSRETVLGFWIDARQNLWKDVTAIKVLSGGKLIAMKSGDGDLSYSYENKNLIYIQTPIKNLSVLKKKLELIIETKNGGSYVYNDFDMKKLKGNLSVYPFENTSRLKNSPFTVYFGGCEKGYDYVLEIYGPGKELVFRQAVQKSSMNLDLSGYPEGEYLFAVYKTDRDSQQNLVTKEYQIYLAN
jgi:hypothetical protein